MKNVLFVICDDLAWGDLACHGNPWLQTPRLDGMQAESVCFSRYCSGPLCTPARAALFTGRHPYRTRAIDTYMGRSMLDHDETTIADIARAAGARTGIFGKWHLGDCYPMRAIDKGFDEALVHNGGGLCQAANLGKDGYFDPDLMHNGHMEPGTGYCSDIFSDAAMSFIEECGEDPFFAYVGYNAPHSPLEIGDEWWERFRGTELPEPHARLYGMVESIDWNVGRLLDCLEQTGNLNETLVVFTSDHGPCGSSLADGECRWNDGLRGIKGSMYEGGIRVPCMLRLPDNAGSTRLIDRLANPIDWMPTLAEAAGWELPTDRVLDGHSLWPLINGAQGNEDWPDRDICMQWHRGDVPVPYRNAVVLGQRYKSYWPADAGGPEVYDLADDPGEACNLADDRSDLVKRAALVYENWWGDVSSTRGTTVAENFAPPRIVVGSDCEPSTTLTCQDRRSYDETQADWGVSAPGFWEIDIASDGNYEIEARIPGSIKKGELEIKLAGERVVSPIGAGRSIRHTIKLPAGCCRAEAIIRDDNERFGVLRLTITRQQSAVD